MSYPAQPIRVGFIGLSPSNWAGQVLFPSLHDSVNSKLYRIVALGARTPETVKAAAAKYSEIVGYEIKAISGQDSASRIANDPDVDFVVISVLTPNHLDVFKAVIEAGKPYFLEWPMGGNDAEIIGEAARAKGVKNMIGLHHKQVLALRKVKEIIDSGRIGRVRNTNMKIFQAREIGVWGPEVKASGEYASDPKNGATMLNVLGGHETPELTLLFGDFKSISATTAIQFPTYTVIDTDGKRSEPHANTQPDHILFTATTTQDVLVTVSWTVGYRKGAKKLLDWEIDGTEGSIRIEGDVFGMPHIARPSVYVDGVEEDLEASYPGENHEAIGSMSRTWTAFAKGDEKGYSTIEEGLKIFEVLNSIKKSAADGQRIDLPTS